MNDVETAAVGGHMPVIVSLEDLAATTSADGHDQRFEASLERLLAVVPPIDTTTASLAAWLISAGVPFGQITSLGGGPVPVPDGRRRVLTVWGRDQPRADQSAAADILLVIEIGSDGAEAIDYAAAGIAHYWTVAQGVEPAITLHRLDDHGTYVVTAQMPLEWLLHMPLAWAL